MNNSIVIPVVRLIISDRLSRILMLQRQNESRGNGGWCPPGGLVEYGETIYQTIGRELKEETNLELIQSDLLFIRDYIEPDVGHWLVMYFECVASGNIILNEESSDYMWLAERDMHKYEIVFNNGVALQKYWERNNSKI
jgi:ADP-ribose pyrophosphatase YjhB (NUDIX family)